MKKFEKLVEIEIMFNVLMEKHFNGIGVIFYKMILIFIAEN